MRVAFAVAVAMLLTMAHSADAQRWRVLTPQLSHTVVINPRDPAKLYVGNWANQLLRSDDRGVTWRTLELGSTNVINYVTSTAVTQADTGVILTGGFWFDGIRRSSDGGETWQRALADTLNNARMWFISEAIIEDPSRPGLLYAARGVTNTGIWRSLDNGITWDSISAVPPQFTGRLCTIAVRPDSTNILFVGATGGQIFRSDDSGRSWRRVPVVGSALSIKSDSEIPKIVFSPRDPSVGYAVVTIILEQNISGNGGVLKTTDGGETWDRIAFADTSLWAVDVRQRNGQDEIFVGGFRLPNTQPIIKGDGLVFRSGDGGSTWQQMLDVPWGTNELDDTIRNVWVIRCDPTSDRVYLATTPGLYVLDEETSVNEETGKGSASTLATEVRDGLIEVTSPTWTSNSTQWSLVDLRGNVVCGGRHDGPLPLRINASMVAAGVYAIELNGGTQRASTLVGLTAR
ncbi:MAG: hypothetical protein FGM33_07125 [Candidatus Kapabacteria bacterium]|nr:hypothetical protein [Candidatus Kapabacteria bacterium]